MENETTLDLTTYYRQQYAAFLFYEEFTGGAIATCDICDLLADAIRRYLEYNVSGNYYAAEMALESSSTYVACDLSEEEFEAYVALFEDYVSAAMDGTYDDDIDFENGIAFEEDDEEA